MISTAVLFVTIAALLVVFAVFFVCYQAQQREREAQAAARDAFDIPAAAVIYSRRSYPTPITRPIQHHHRYSRKAPTPYTVVCNLPCYQYDASQARGYESGGLEKPQCVICCCDYEQDDKLKILPCLHKYHEECIDAWLKRDHICPICQADVVLAAGLSMHDWSQHTLDSVNVVSGATSPAPTTPSAPAASSSIHNSPAASVPNTRPETGAGRPATAPAATQGASSSSANTCSTDQGSHAASLEHVKRTAEALAAAIAALPSSPQQQVLAGQTDGTHHLQQQEQQQRVPNQQQVVTNSSSAATASGHAEALDATCHRGRDNISRSTDGNCFVYVGGRPGVLGAGDAGCGAEAAHVALTIQPARDSASTAAASMQ